MQITLLLSIILATLPHDITNSTKTQTP